MMIEVSGPMAPMPVVAPIPVVAVASHLAVVPILVAAPTPVVAFHLVAVPIPVVAVVLRPVKHRNWGKIWFPG